MDEFEQVYRAHYPSVYRFVLGLSRDSALAEEIAQETFFRAIKKIGDFRGNCSLNTWLCQIAKNLYFSHVRKFGRVRALFGGVLPESDHAGVEESLMDKQAAKKLHHALHALREPYKEVFSLRVFAELSFQEIAALFLKTESWARVTYYRAKGMLQVPEEEEETK